MNNLKQIIAFSLSLSLLIAPLFTIPESDAQAAFRPSGYVGKLLTRLNEGGSETSFRTSPGIAPDGTSLSTAKIGDYIVLTINPGGANEEKISATAVSVSGTTATWTIGTRGLSFTEAAQVTDNINQHAIGETVIISNDDHFLSTQYPSRDGNETVTGLWNFPYPTASTSPATKGYADTVLSGGTLNIDRVQTAAIAGETFSTGTPVYFKRADARWYKAGTNIEEATEWGILGLAQGIGAAGISIAGGVLMAGLDSTQTSMTAGTNIFLSSTAGATTTATTTIGLGKAKSATELYFDPHAFKPSLGTDNLWTGSSTFSGNVSYTGALTSFGSLSGFSGKSYLNTAPTSISGGGASTTIFAQPIAANTLSTGNYYKGRVFIKGQKGGPIGTCALHLDLGYGNASTTFNYDQGAATDTGTGYFDYILAANGSASAQSLFSINSFTSTTSNASAATTTTRWASPIFNSANAGQITLIARPTSAGCYFDPFLVSSEYYR